MSQAPYCVLVATPPSGRIQTLNPMPTAFRLDRRALLKGMAGVALPLPLLEAMGKEVAEETPRRFCAFYVANGMTLPDPKLGIDDWSWFPRAQKDGEFVFSVANHSILVWTIFCLENPKIEKKWQLASLLHDAPEYVIGDLISPVKKEVGSSYTSLEKKLQEAIHIRFGLPALIPKKIKSKIKIADRKAAWIEATVIAGFNKKEADKIFLEPDDKIIRSCKIVLKDPLKTRKEFLNIYKKLEQ